MSEAVDTGRDFMNKAPAQEPFETIQVQDRVIACDGGNGPLGHPRVFLKILARDIVCPYCSRRYVLTEEAAREPQRGTAH